MAVHVSHCTSTESNLWSGRGSMLGPILYWRLKLTCLHAPQPDECTCRYRCHQYCWADFHRRCGPWEWDRALRQHRAVSTKLPGLPFNQRVLQNVVGGLLDVKDVCRATTVVALIIAIAVPACHVHLCTISFDLWVQWYLFKTIIYGSQKSADSIRTNCGKVRGFGCELRIRNNSI